MIERTAMEAPLWDDRKAVVYALVESADVLWTENPARARAWLNKAWETIASVSNLPQNDQLKDFFTRSDQSELRSSVLTVARKYDPQFAEHLLKRLSEEPASENKRRGAFDDRTVRSEQLLSMAQQVLNEHPQAALALASNSLTDGISYSLQNVLTDLRQKDIQLSNSLFDLALSRFSAGFPDPSEAHVLAGYLFQSGFTFSANSSGQTILVVNPAQQNLPSVAAGEPHRARSFLAAVYQTLLSRPLALNTEEDRLRARQLLVLGDRLNGPYRTFAPELHPGAQGFLAYLRRQVSPIDSAAAQTESGPASTGRRTIDSANEGDGHDHYINNLIEKADRENNPIAKKLGYVEAALLTQPREYERAKRILERIDDDVDLRTDATSFVLYRAALFFINKSDLETSAPLIPQIQNNSRRAVARLAVARRLVLKAQKSGGEQLLERESAFQLLDDVERDLARDSTSKRARINLGRISVLATLDKDRALVVLEDVVQLINKLQDFDLLSRAAPNLGLGGFSISAATIAAPPVSFDFPAAIETLVSSNFEEVVSAAERFESKELRGIARLEAAKLYLKQTADAKQSPRLVSR